MRYVSHQLATEDLCRPDRARNPNHPLRLVWGVLFLFTALIGQLKAQTAPASITVSGACLTGTYVLEKAFDNYEGTGRPAYLGSGTVTIGPTTYEGVGISVYYVPSGPAWVMAFDGQPYQSNPATSTLPPTSGWVAETSGTIGNCAGSTPLTVSAPVPVNVAPTTTGISNQMGTVSQGFSLNVASSFSDPNGDVLSFTANGLPAGLSLSGSTISGTPSVSGVSSVTVVASDPGSLSVSSSFTLTVSPASVVVPPTAPFSITGVSTVSCTTISAGQRQLSFTPRYAGLSGQPISFSVVNEMLPTTAPGPYTLNPYIDNPNLTLKATQSGTAGEASFVYNWLAACGTGVGNATARLKAEPMTPLRVSVLGNPVVNGSLDVVIQGAQGQALRLVLTDMQGHVVTEQYIGSAVAREHQTLKIGRGAGGVLLLRVSTTTQQQVVKVLVP